MIRKPVLTDLHQKCTLQETSLKHQVQSYFVMALGKNALCLRVSPVVFVLFVCLFLHSPRDVFKAVLPSFQE